MPKDTAGEKAFGCFLIVASFPLGMIARGWALTVMWGWFVVPLGVMQISFPHALGLTGCVTLFAGHLASIETSKEDAGIADVAYKSFGVMVLAPLFITGFGWIFHQFM